MCFNVWRLVLSQQNKEIFLQKKFLFVSENYFFFAVLLLMLQKIYIYYTENKTTKLR